MDFNSGRFPLDLFSFYLDMSSEDVTEKNTLQLPSTAENEQPANSSQEVTVVRQSSVQAVSKVGCEAPTSSPSTGESVSNYVERKLQEMGQQPEAQILPPLDAEKESLPQLQKSRRRPCLTPSSKPSPPLKVSQKTGWTSTGLKKK